MSFRSQNMCQAAGRSEARSVRAERARLRFEAKFSKGVGCWEWAAGLTSRGYGWIVVDGRQWLAHRLAWTLANGPIAPGLVVAHRCDNPKCVRPDHLFVGTQKENIADMYRKGRAAYRARPYPPIEPARQPSGRPRPGTRAALERRYGRPGDQK